MKGRIFEKQNKNIFCYYVLIFNILARRLRLYWTFLIINTKPTNYCKLSIKSIDQSQSADRCCWPMRAQCLEAGGVINHSSPAHYCPPILGNNIITTIHCQQNSYLQLYLWRCLALFYVVLITINNKTITTFKNTGQVRQQTWNIIAIQSASNDE